MLVDFGSQVGVKLKASWPSNRWKIDPKRLGRLHIALGTLQEAPGRESLIFQWFWEVFWGGGRHGRAWARNGEGFRARSLNPKIKPNTPGTGTGLGCLVSGLSPVHGHGLLGVWPLTSTSAWAYGVCCLTLAHAVAQSAVADPPPHQGRACWIRA